tara:strand:+ start:313 stop:588 length:276 start_codon:yes stop_codon:yes gene_type:complete
MQKLNSAIKNFLQKNGLEKGVNQNKSIELWPEIVGEKISKNTEPQTVESGTLIIKTKNSAWRQELIFKQSEILESINKKLGKNTIKAIRFI